MFGGALRRLLGQTGDEPPLLGIELLEQAAVAQIERTARPTFLGAALVAIVKAPARVAGSMRIREEATGT